jgi:hypothetical protein
VRSVSSASIVPDHTTRPDATTSIARDPGQTVNGSPGGDVAFAPST